MVVEQIGDVALGVGSVAIDVQLGVDVLTLTGDGDPVVEAGAGRSIDAHMPLADEGRFVAGVVEEARPSEEGVAFAAAIDVVDDAVRVGVEAGEKAAAAGRAEGRGGESISEVRPFAG